MAVGRGEEHEVVGRVAGGLGGGVEGVAGDDDGGCVGGAAALGADAAGVRGCEAVEGGEGAGGGFLDYGEGGGYLEDVELLGGGWLVG